MPGFGSGPFGVGQFGEWHWSRQMLFLNIPEVYRQEDAAGDGELETLTEALRLPYDQLRQKVRSWADLRDPLEVRTQYDETACLRLGKQVVEVGDFDRGGVDGTVLTLAGITKFKAKSGNFNEKDIGKTLIVRQSATASNNRNVQVSTIESPSRITTIPSLAVDAGPLTWELREKTAVRTDRVVVEVRSGAIDKVVPGWLLNDGFADFKVLARNQFDLEKRLLLSEVTQRGNELTIQAVGAFESIVSTPGAEYTQFHVGSSFVIRGSSVDQNNVKTYIRRIVTSSKVTIAALLDSTEPDNGKLEWELRATPVLAHLTLFGVSLPKGLVEQEGESLTIDSVGVLTSNVSLPTGNLSSTDEGKRLTISGGDEPENNATVEVATVSSLSELIVLGELVLPEANNGSLRWELRTATGAAC